MLAPQNGSYTGACFAWASLINSSTICITLPPATILREQTATADGLRAEDSRRQRAIIVDEFDQARPSKAGSSVRAICGANIGPFTVLSPN